MCQTRLYNEKSTFRALENPMRIILIAVTALLSISINAYAGDNGVYVGAALGRSSIDTDVAFFGFNFKDEDTGYKLIGGFRPLDRFGLEINYVDFGSIVFDNRATVGDGVRTEYEAQAIDAFAMGYIGGPFVEVFGKLGLVAWDADAVLQGGFPGVDLRDSDNGTDLVYGAGVQAQLGSWAARLEYEAFDVPDTDKLELWSLGVTLTFF